MARSGALLVVPARNDEAARNMAVDTALLEAFPNPQAARLRHYGWQGDAWTFGYGQRQADIQAQLPAGAQAVRRPTGGGLVDHRDDWTYALVVPAAHPLCRARAAQSYMAVHKALAQALCACGAPARLALGDESHKGPLAACFIAPSPGDVVSPTGQKIAGAAQKRNRHGLLVQGSIAKARARVDWRDLELAFTLALAESLDLAAQNWETDWAIPQALCQRYQSPQWNARR